MNIHIRGTVEFEKTLSQKWSSSIECTRQRMALQQLLDTLESKEELEKRAKDYTKVVDKLLLHLSKNNATLVEQPNFEWSVGDDIIQTPCWKIESIMPRVVLAYLLHDNAVEQINESNFKNAHKLLLKSSKIHNEIENRLVMWKWKLPELNHFVLKRDWHSHRHYHLNGLAQLCTLCVGIQNMSSSSILYTLSQRALKHFCKATAFWFFEEPKEHSYIPLAESLRYFYSSEILWARGQYGASIHTLEHWLKPNHISTGPFQLLQNELEKVPPLLHEKHTSNNGVYFEIISPATPLPSPSELIHTLESIDIPHPQEKQEGLENHDDEPTP